ncbi:M56 family metallopeptidase [Candidatus Daviesbacteria bacterium]|nr:M56 family metallopeptidase [Candidatus Daviesbacteria bacterium]
MSNKTGINQSYIILVLLGLVAGAISIALLAKVYPLFSAKALYFCQQFVANTFFMLPHTLPGAFATAVWAVLSLGLISFLIQLAKTYALLRKTIPKKIPLTRKLQETVNSLGLGNSTQLIEDKNLYSFCIGFLNPKIIITSGLISDLTQKELEAVLLHEQMHLKNRDPLKILIGKTVSSTFFFLPIFRELYRNMEATNELIADYWTTEIQKDTKFLRSALRKIIAQPQITFATVPAISHPDHIEIRVRQLKNTGIKHKLTLSYSSIIGSAMFIVVSLFVLQTPVDAFHTEDSSEPSYFVCSVDNVCRQECHHNSNMSVPRPDHLFTPVNSSPTSSKYEAPSYK